MQMTDMQGAIEQIRDKDRDARGGSFFIHQGAAGGAASLPGPSAVLVK